MIIVMTVANMKLFLVMITIIVQTIGAIRLMDANGVLLVVKIMTLVLINGVRVLLDVFIKLLNVMIIMHVLKTNVIIV
jgi:hypothetical protein